MKIPKIVHIDLNINVNKKLNQTQKYYIPEQKIYGL